MTTTALEIIRRVALLFAIPIGALMIAWPASSLLDISGVDWEAQRRREIASLLSEEARRDINAYIREETEGHVVTLPADPWRDFIGQVRETLAGRPPTPAWNAAAERSEYDHQVRTIYLDSTEPLPAKLSALPEMASGYAYLRLEDEESVPPVLRLQRRDFSVTHSGAPQFMIYPLRHAGWWVILASMLIYALVPWSRPAVNEYCPITPRMAFLTDIVSVLLYGTFVSIWSNLILEPGIPGHGEWSQIIVLTIVFWGMALAGTAIFVVALWYITFRLQWDGEGLRQRTLFGEKFQPWADIEGLNLQPKVYRFAKRIRAVALLFSIYNWRLAGPALLMQTESAFLHLSTRKGEGWNIDLGNLSPQGLARLVDELLERGIPVSPEVAELGKSVDEATHPPRLFAVYLVLALLTAIVIYEVWRTKPQ